MTGLKDCISSEVALHIAMSTSRCNRPELDRRPEIVIKISIGAGHMGEAVARPREPPMPTRPNSGLKELSNC
jgi:hypothetical protein